MPTLRTIAFTVCDETTLILVHGRSAPSNEDWACWVEQIESTRTLHHNLGALIVTPHGAGPNAAQRKRVTDALASQAHAVAVMSDHRATRVIITAFSWFNSEVKSYRAGDYLGAARHLRLGDEWEGRLSTEVVALKHNLSLGVVSAPSPSSR